MLVMGLAPILAPLGGGLLLALFGWQSIFLCLTLFSALCGLALALWLPETLAKDAPPAPLRGALGEYRRLFGDWPFLGYALTGGFAIAGMFAYIAGSPFVFIELYGVPAEHYGWLFGSNALGFILVAQLNAWRDGSRHNDPNDLMGHVAKSLSAEEVTAVADYFAGLKPQEAQP